MSDESRHIPVLEEIGVVDFKGGVRILTGSPQTTVLLSLNNVLEIVLYCRMIAMIIALALDGTRRAAVTLTFDL